MPKPTLLDLFCGAGGMSHGLQQAGFTVLGGADLDADSLKTFQANHPESRVVQIDLAQGSPVALADTLGIYAGQVDCIVGGPPCQGFSRNRAFRHVNGEFVDDPRNHLYQHFFKFIAYYRPKVALLENVPEILIKSNEGEAFRDIVYEGFDKLGYRVESRVVNAADYGVPQHRRRAFFLAGRDFQHMFFPGPSTVPGPRAGGRTPRSTRYAGVKPLSDLFADKPAGPSVWDAIGDLCGEYTDALDGTCGYGHKSFTDYQAGRRTAACEVQNHYRWPLTERQLQRIRLLTEGQGQLHLPKELQTRDGYGSAYRRLQADAQALTITTWMFHPGSGMFTHPFENRVITIREAARLQSFQDTFRFYGRYHSQCRQIGNAVAPLVARAIGGAMLSALGIDSPQDSIVSETTP